MWGKGYGKECCQGCWNALPQLHVAQDSRNTVAFGQILQAMLQVHLIMTIRANIDSV